MAVGNPLNDDSGSTAGEGDRRPPHLDESIRRVRSAGRETVDAAVDSGRALRKLVFADLALARSALGRALAWFAVAIIFGASAWLFAMGAFIALLQGMFSLSWLAAISAAMLVSLVVTGVAAWRVSVFFDHAGMHATRRQLARLGIGDEGEGEDEDVDFQGGMRPPPPSAATPATAPSTGSPA